MQRSKRRLAGSGKADHGEELTLGHLEADVLEGEHAPVVDLRQVLDLEHVPPRWLNSGMSWTAQLWGPAYAGPHNGCDECYSPMFSRVSPAASTI